MALEAGFRRFDTAEADWWYDQKSVGSALGDFFGGSSVAEEDECVATSNNNDDDEGEPTCRNNNAAKSCGAEDLRISTKIPPWSLTSLEDIRVHARESRSELVGFCEDEIIHNDVGERTSRIPFPLDVYYIHAPQCWKGWHPRCDNPPPLLNIYDAWYVYYFSSG